MDLQLGPRSPGKGQKAKAYRTQHHFAWVGGAICRWACKECGVLFRKPRHNNSTCTQLSNVLRDCHPSHRVGVCVADKGGGPLLFCHKCGFYGQFRTAGLSAPRMCPQHKTNNGKGRTKGVVTGAGARHFSRIARGLHPDSHRSETVSRPRYMLTPDQLKSTWGKVQGGSPVSSVKPSCPMSKAAGCGFDIEGDPSEWFGEAGSEDDFACPS